MSTPTSQSPPRPPLPLQRGRAASIRRTRALAVVLVTCLLAAASACGVTRGAESKDLDMWIPNSPGGGYDQTGRAAVGVLDRGDMTGGDIQVTNILGAGGSVAMSRLMSEEGNGN